MSTKNKSVISDTVSSCLEFAKTDRYAKQNSGWATIAAGPIAIVVGLLPCRIVLRESESQYVVHTECFDADDEGKVDRVSWCWGHYFLKSDGEKTKGRAVSLFSIKVAAMFSRHLVDDTLNRAGEDDY